jgi:hypothetical protein
MSTVEAIIEKILREPPPVPLSRAWWSARQVAAYLDVTPKFVTDTLSSKPGFPEAKRLPSERGQGRLRWRAAEVISWWERQ